jgi:hypothetical protein
MKPADELAAEAAQTRRELGETLDALAHKADVKGRLQHLGTDVAAEARATAEQVGRDPVGLLLLAAAAGVAVAIVLIMRGRRS